MSQPVANCPNCGAPVRFLFSSAVQSVCEYCRSIVVRRDVNLERVGEVADLPPDPSPIQITTEGIYRNRPFVVAGRILYEYAQGGWNEWHIVFSDGSSGWLSDAMAEYAISFAVVPPPEPLPEAAQLHRGRCFRWFGADYQVTVLTRARYRGTEGELPFEYWNKEEILFADLRTRDAHFATIDYSEAPPLLFVGESVEFDSLRFKNLRRVEGWDA